MISQNLHMHTTFDDGRSTAEEMVQACLAAGLTSCGVSLHAPMTYPTDWTCGVEGIPAYLAEMRRLREAYAGKITVYCGIEWDTLSEVDLTPYDYVIGSAHHLPVRMPPYSVDNKPEEAKEAIRVAFGGDADAAAECYFAELSKVANNPAAQILGHFDVLTKFDMKHGIFNADSPRYRKAALTAMETLVKAGKIFEINTGAIGRKWRTEPYPARPLLEALYEMGGKITFSSDSHSAADVVCAFDQAEALAKACGFTQTWVLGPDGQFMPQKL